MSDPVSATELFSYIQDVKKHFESTGEDLNEGAARVLHKLRHRQPGERLRRTYVRVEGQGYAMWDVITDAELQDRGYRDTDAHSYGLVGDRHVTSDTITYWTSEQEHGHELWVGEPMLD